MVRNERACEKGKSDKKTQKENEKKRNEKKRSAADLLERVKSARDADNDGDKRTPGREGAFFSLPM